MMKDRIEEILEKQQEESSTRNELYEYLCEIERSYYPVFGLKFFMTGPEGTRRTVINEVIKLLRAHDFEVHAEFYEKPKVIDGKCHYFVSIWKHPEKN